MAVKRKSSGGGGGANWMDTYGDMVTLLMCFFVLLYSMSTISEDKFRALVQSFNPSSLEDAPATAGSEGPLAEESEGIGSEWGMEAPTEETIEEPDIEDILAQLAQMLQATAQETGSSEDIEVTTGDGYVFVTFNDAVFFTGDSAVVQPEGQRILDGVAWDLEQVARYIDEVRILGHTAQSDPERPNNVSTDRTLSSMRATNVTAYIQERCSVSPARLVSVGYGQWRPVDTNWTPEGRANNRRVEMIITGTDLEDEMGDALKQYQSLRGGGTTGGTAGESGTLELWTSPEAREGTP